MSEILLHVGYPKTATTFLQENLFRDAQGPFHSLGGQYTIDREIVRPHPLVFEADQALKAFKPELALARNAGKCAVLTSEVLCGNPFFGGRDCQEYANRLKVLFPDSRVLVTVRSQPEILRSTYKQYVRRGGVLTAIRFFNPETEPGYYGFDPVFFEYDRYYEFLASVFGKDRVLFLPYELFVMNPNAFFQELFEFCGLDWGDDGLQYDFGERRGRGAADGVLPVLRNLNRIRGGEMSPRPPIGLYAIGRLLYRGVEWAGARLPILQRQKSLKTLCQSIAMQRYADSNARLAALTGREFGALGYPLP